MATGNPWNMLQVLSNNGNLNLDTSSVGLGRSLCLASVLGRPRVVAALDVDRYRRSLSGREIDRGLLPSLAVAIVEHTSLRPNSCPCHLSILQSKTRRFPCHRLPQIHQMSLKEDSTESC